jgi:hypothetical protein
MKTASLFIHKDCLQIQIWCTEISTLEWEGHGSLIKESSTKMVGDVTRLWKTPLICPCIPPTSPSIPLTESKSAFLNTNHSAILFLPQPIIFGLQNKSSLILYYSIKLVLYYFKQAYLCKFQIFFWSNIFIWGSNASISTFGQKLLEIFYDPFPGRDPLVEIRWSSLSIPNILRKKSDLFGSRMNVRMFCTLTRVWSF